eukprot:TRINITY_DN832_c0_g1_i2.p5 TRINITY_DN832_c0_g1~~TRINITY_DN832_c0_g1_i2.p5  ORF type:complete len:103 (-),score=45.11 TRINITY_DN832_c0_g1_i2:169-477(-)
MDRDDAERRRKEQLEMVEEDSESEEEGGGPEGMEVDAKPACGEPMLEPLLLLCHEKFLGGEDGEWFDYSKCDNDGGLCDLEEHIDAEGAYFEDDDDDDDDDL